MKKWLSWSIKKKIKKKIKTKKKKKLNGKKTNKKISNLNLSAKKPILNQSKKILLILQVMTKKKNRLNKILKMLLKKRQQVLISQILQLKSNHLRIKMLLIQNGGKKPMKREGTIKKLKKAKQNLQIRMKIKNKKIINGNKIKIFLKDLLKLNMKIPTLVSELPKPSRNQNNFLLQEAAWLEYNLKIMIKEFLESQIKKKIKEKENKKNNQNNKMMSRKILFNNKIRIKIKKMIGKKRM